MRIPEAQVCPSTFLEALASLGRETQPRHSGKCPGPEWAKMTQWDLMVVRAFLADLSGNVTGTVANPVGHL